MTKGLSTRTAARELRVSPSQVHRARQDERQSESAANVASAGCGESAAIQLGNRP